MDATAAAIEELDRAIEHGLRVRLRGGQVVVESPDNDTWAFLDAPADVATRSAESGPAQLGADIVEALFARDAFPGAPLRLVAGGVRAVNPCR